jgi:sugar lactone lactonase YvrE
MRATIAALVGGLIVLGGNAPAHDPVAEPVELFASGLAGPEGLAFLRRGGLVVGSTTGEIRRYAVDGTYTVLANVGESVAGITELRDGRVLAASLLPDHVWSIAPDGTTTLFASGVGNPNFIVQTRSGRIFASATGTGNIVDITTGTAVVVASGLTFPNGLAIGRAGGQRYLYVAETIGGRVSRFPLDTADNLGPKEVYATGITLADGLAFDREGNLLAVGGGMLKVIDRDTRAVSTLSSDPLLNWPSNLAFGRHRFGRRSVYLANFGPGLGDGTTVVRFRFNHCGARLSR